MDISKLYAEWHDTIIDDAFAYWSRKLLERIKKEYYQWIIKENKEAR